MRVTLPRRPTRNQHLLLLCGAISLLLAGCVHHPRVTQTAGEGAEVVPLSPRAEARLEQRVEALAHYATGISKELNNQPSEATDEFYEAALRDMEEEGLVLEVARRLIREQKNAQAIEVLQKLEKRKNTPSTTYALLGLAYMQNGQTNLAIQANQRSIKRAPENLAGYQNLAALYLDTSRTNDAVRILRQATGRADASPEFLLGAADLLSRYNRQQLLSDAEARETTLRLLDAAAGQAPDNPVIMQRIADLYLRHGEAIKAAPLYERLLERFPGVTGLRERLANIYLGTDNDEKAAKLLEEIQQQNPTDPSTYYFLGSLAYETREYEKAAENFETALKLNPEFEPLYYDLAAVHIARHEPERALALLERARSKFQLNFVMEFYNGIAHAVLENWPEAISRLTSAELLAKTGDPSRLNHVFYYQLGSAFERSGNIPEAVKALQRAIELSPEYADALNYLGYMWAERGENLQEAHAMIERAVKQEPDNAAFLDSLAWVLFKMGRHQEALAWMQKAIDAADEADPTLLDHLGDIEAALHQYDKAREAYEQSLAAKHDERVKLKLDALPAARER